MLFDRTTTRELRIASSCLLPSLTSALARRCDLFGPMDPAEHVDPVFSAVAELDRTASALAAVFTAWVDGPDINCDDDTANGIEAAAAVNDAARDRLMITPPSTELGAAAFRAAVQRYVDRPTGSRVEGDAMLARLGVMLTAET